MKNAVFAAALFIMVGHESSGQDSVPPPPPPASGAVLEGDPTSAGGTNTAPVVTAPAKPVEINGKPASELTPDEIQAFLQSKIRDIYQYGDQVEQLHIAPGYPLTLKFEQEVGTVIIGDPSMVTQTKIGKLLVLQAKARGGDTTLVVTLPGDVLLNYHIFIEPNFVTADTTLTVHNDDEETEGQPGKKEPDFRQIARILGNYDALVQEKALDVRNVARIPIGIKSPFGTFDYYYWYVFSDGTTALTFKASNPTSGDVPFDAQRVRILMGNGVYYSPELVSAPSDTIPPRSAITGFAVFRHPPFRINQPFELVLR